MTQQELDRFWQKVIVDPSGCWTWTGATTGSREGETGYGNLRIGGRTRAAHILAFEHFVGPVPEGLVLDHLCRERICVNPTHLEPVTHRENIMRGVGATAQHAAAERCVAGHEFDRVRVRPNGVERACSICERRRWRESKRRIRAGLRAAA